MRRAFSLLEVLTCIAIIVVVAAISFPAFSAAKAYAKRSSASSNLWQLYLAAALYRTDQGGDGVYGDVSQMGLPIHEGHFPTPYDQFLKPLKQLWKSPCGLNTGWYQRNSWEPATGPLVDVIYRASDDRTFATYAATYRENTLLFYDLNCDDPDTPVGNQYLDHRGLGVLVEGQLVNHYKPGLMLGNDSWWSSPAGG